MSYKLLIVDDSSITRAVLKKTIQMTQIPIEEILEASNGREGLEMLEQHQIDLILADLNMPEMNGLEMAELILTREETRHIPMVIVSTEASATRIEKLKAQGVQSYIHKPFTPEKIRDVLSVLLELCPS